MVVGSFSFNPIQIINSYDDDGGEKFYGTPKPIGFLDLSTHTSIYERADTGINRPGRSGPSCARDVRSVAVLFDSVKSASFCSRNSDKRQFVLSPFPVVSTTVGCQ